jgi:hypothetical protein
VICDLQDKNFRSTVAKRHLSDRAVVVAADDCEYSVVSGVVGVLLVWEWVEAELVNHDDAERLVQFVSQSQRTVMKLYHHHRHSTCER